MGGHFLLQSDFGSFVQDERAHKAVWDSKGAGGTKCCSDCKNAVYGPERADAYFINVKRAVPNEFDRHTTQSVFETIDLLRAEKLRRSKGAFKQVE